MPVYSDSDSDDNQVGPQIFRQDLPVLNPKAIAQKRGETRAGILAKPSDLFTMIRTKKTEQLAETLDSFGAENVLNADSCINTSVLEVSDKDPLIKTAINSLNYSGIDLILKYLILKHQCLPKSILEVLINGYANNKTEPNRLTAVINAYSDVLNKDSPLKSPSSNRIRSSLALVGSEKILGIVKECYGLISGQKNEEFGKKLDTFRNDHDVPLFNSSGYMLNGIDVYKYTPNGSNIEEVEYGFKFSQKSIFPHCLETNNPNAAFIVLDMIIDHYPQGTPIQFLFDIVNHRKRLHLFPKVIKYISDKILTPFDKSEEKKEFLITQLIKNPITEKSIFSVMLSSIESKLNETGNSFGNGKENKQEVDAMMNEMFECVILLLNLITQIHFIPLEVRRGDFMRGLFDEANKAIGKAIVTDNTNGLFEKLEKKAKEGVDTGITLMFDSFIESVHEKEQLIGQNNKKSERFEEFILSIFINFIPYLKPQLLFQSFQKLPQRYINRYKLPMSRLPQYFYRFGDYDTPFKPHQASYLISQTPPSPTAPRGHHHRHLITANLLNSSTTPTNENGLGYCNNYQDDRIKLFQKLNKNDQNNVHIITLLKLHPVTILQMLHLYSDEFESTFPITQMGKCLIDQFNDVSFTSDVVLNNSITTHKDSPFFYNLYERVTILPCLVPIIAPTITDFVNYCRFKAKSSDNTHEKSFYYQYMVEILCQTGHNVTRAARPTKTQTTQTTQTTKSNGDIISILTDGLYSLETVNELKKAAGDWSPEDNLMRNNLTRFHEVKCMKKNQSDTSLRRLCDPSTTLVVLNNHSIAARNGTVLGAHGEPLFVNRKDGEENQNKNQSGNPIVDLLMTFNPQFAQSFLNSGLEYKCDNDDQAYPSENEVEDAINELLEITQIKVE
jgi:hypothetical protein